MGKIAISLFLRLAVCSVIFYVYFAHEESEYTAPGFSSYYNVTITTKDTTDKYVVVPEDYVHWFHFLNAASYNYNKVIYRNGNTVKLQHTMPYEIQLKGGSRYFALKETAAKGVYTLAPNNHPPVNTTCYLAMYLVIFITLIILPNFITYLFDRYLFQLSRTVSYMLLAAGLVYSAALVGYVYLTKWIALAGVWLAV